MLWSKLLTTAHLAAMLHAEPVLIVDFGGIPGFFNRAIRRRGFTGFDAMLHKRE